MNEKIQDSMAKSLVAIFMFFQLYLNLVFTDDNAMALISIDLGILAFIGIFITFLNVFFFKLEIIRKENSNLVYGLILFVFLILWISKGSSIVSIHGDFNLFWLHFVGIATCVVNLFLILFLKH